MKKYFLLLALAGNCLWAANLLSNGDFQQISNGKLRKWQPMIRWAGKSVYRHIPGTACIERPADDKGAGAYMSADVPVQEGKDYTFSVKYKMLSEKNARCDLAINWYDVNHKKLSYNLIRRVKNAGEGIMQGKRTAPANAAFVRVLLVMSGAGNIEFSDASVDDGIKSAAVPAASAAGNLLRDAGFKELKNGLPTHWKTSRWPGKTTFTMRDGLPLISRTEELNKAGAFISTPVPLKGQKSLTIAGEIKTDRVSTNSDISIQFLDRTGKSIHYHLIGRVKGNTPWKRFSKLINVPDKAVAVRMLLVQCGTGETTFRNLLISEKAPEAVNTRVEASLILNGSFEEADLNADFTDCFTLLKGKAQRTPDAAHGYHAVELAPGSEISYGSASAGAAAVKAKDRFFFSFFCKNAENTVVELHFFDSASRRIAIEKIPGTAGNSYVFREKLLNVPSGAVSASLFIRNNGKTPAKIDALHLGKNKFDGKKVMTIPHFPMPKAVPEQKFPATTIKPHKGVPTWFIDGKNVDFAMFTVSSINHNSRKDWYGYARRVLKEGQFPVIVIAVYITPENRGESHTMETAMRDTDFRIRSTLAEIPDARFILWVMQEPSFALAAKYPTEIIRLEDTSLKWRDQVPPYSYGSEIWSRLCAVRLGELLNEISKKSYGDRIVGISPGMGKFGENNFGHANTVGGYSPHDFSPAMINFFRKWLFNEYKGDVLAFAAAWERPGMNFTDAVTPGTARRLTKNNATFFDPAKNRQSIDYIRCESFAIMHRVLRQCEAAKKFTNGKLFTFTQFAYFTGSMFQRELQVALKNPYLDALGPAPPYINRGPGDDIPDHGPAASVLVNNKVWLFQADVRTHLASDHNWRYGRTADEKESVAVFLRDLGHYMTTGTIPYYMSFEKWYDSPEMIKLVRNFSNYLRLSSRFPRRSKAQIAVVIDPVSLAIGHEYSYVRRIMPPQQSTLEYNRTFEWHKLGAPYDFYMLDDLLEQKDLSQYKAVIFAANYAINDTQRKLIKEKLQKDGRTLIWFFAPGIFNKKDSKLWFDKKNARISGFDFEYDFTPGALEIKLPDGRIFGKFTTDIYGGFTTPANPRKVRNETFRPRLIVKKAQNVEILGSYAADGKPAFARRKGREHTDIFWGSSALNKEVLIPLLKTAGVHIYTDKPAVVYANGNFAAIHSGKKQLITVTLPEKAQVICDLYTGKEVAVNSDKATFEMDKNSSVLLYFGEKEALKKAWTAILNDDRARRTRNDAEKSKYAYAMQEIKNLAKPVDPAQIFPVENNGTISHWQILWSFPGHAADAYGFDKDFIGEKSFAGEFSREYPVEFVAGESDTLEKLAWFKGKAGKQQVTLKWRPLLLSQGGRSMYQEVSDPPFGEYISYYAACYVISDRERELILSIGSDDGEKSFFNGKQITARKVVSRRMTPDSEQGVVKLKKGKNLLLLKVCQGGGGVGHTVRFLDPADNKPATDLKITLK